MDKLKEQLAVLRQHSFWIMCVGILIVSLASWYLSTTAVAEQHESQIKKIGVEFKKLRTMKLQNPNHPNAATAAGMDQLMAAYAREVDAGWQKQYDQQATVLVWPASFDAEFHAAVNKYRPIETLRPGAAITQELPLDLRQLYRNYIENDLPSLAKTIGADWKASSAGVATTPPANVTPSADGTTPAVDDKSVVLWNPENQQQLLLSHFGFITGDVPSTLQVLYAQEDLWVLQNIMDIIKVTNDNATARHEAVIKQIEFVRIGRSALGLAGAVTKVGTSATPGADGSPPGMSPVMTPGVQPSAESAPPPAPSGEIPAMDPNAGGDPGALVTTDPASGRYVDEKYQPIFNPDRLRNALISKEETDALLAVAKRIPVRLRFKLDQRKLNVLLASCGNARLPVEVRQVRVNPDRVSNAPLSGGDGGMPGTPGFGIEGGLGGMGRPPKTIVSDSTIDPTLIDVELYGIVYIYNPVNKGQLGEAPAGGPPTAAVSPAPVSTGG